MPPTTTIDLGILFGEYTLTTGRWGTEGSHIVHWQFISFHYVATAFDCSSILLDPPQLSGFLDLDDAGEV